MRADGACADGGGQTREAQINNLCGVEALLGNAEQRYFTVHPPARMRMRRACAAAVREARDAT